uniref:Uncharacterized protein n=1 Tax=Amphora coffeiformis TaxID=265554 RepID=A0A7S3KYN4_9STRA|eukprot:scaffold7344_cov122-Amphora_coffeaeformis.AAC.6
MIGVPTQHFVGAPRLVKFVLNPTIRGLGRPRSRVQDGMLIQFIQLGTVNFFTGFHVQTITGCCGDDGCVNGKSHRFDGKAPNLSFDDGMTRCYIALNHTTA